MTGDNSLGKRLLQILDRIVQMQRAKRRRDFQRTATDTADGVAARAIGLHEDQASLRGWL